MDVRTVLLLLQLSLSTGMLTRDMCANFIYETTNGSMTLHTPGYTQGLKYPNSSYCVCEIFTRRATSQPKSLNVTVLGLDMEECSTASRPYDFLSVQTVHKFQPFYQISTLCGKTLPLSSVEKLSLTDEDGNKYGEGNTLFSLEYIKLELTTDAEIEFKGVELLLESHRGLKVTCQGVSGDISTTTLPTTTTRPTTTTTTSVYPGNKFNKEDEARKRSTTTTAVIIGVVIVVLAIGMAVGVFILIRNRKAKNDPHSNASGPRRQSDGRPIYKDPCLGMPSLPMPSSVDADVSDQYLYMRNSATTPVYENPQLMGDQALYINEEMNGGATGTNRGGSTEEVEYNGYIIPGCGPGGVPSTTGRGGDDGAPLLKGLVMTERKAPIPEPKKQRSKPFVESALVKKLSVDSLSSERPLLSQNNSPELNQRHETQPTHSESTTPKPVVYEPALLKPSALKNNAKAGGGALLPPHMHSKPVVKVNNNPPAPPAEKPYIRTKNFKTKMQGLTPPPPPPNKPKVVAQSPEEDSYQVVNVETVS